MIGILDAILDFLGISRTAINIWLIIFAVAAEFGVLVRSHGIGSIGAAGLIGVAVVGMAASLATNRRRALSWLLCLAGIGFFVLGAVTYAVAPH